MILLSFTICASMMPENVKKIQIAARDLIVTCGNHKFPAEQLLFNLKRIEKEDVVYISPCSLFSVNRGFILTAAGATLAYDLLIINFK